MHSASAVNGSFISARNASTSGSPWLNRRWKTGWSCLTPYDDSSRAADCSRIKKGIYAEGFESGFRRLAFNSRMKLQIGNRLQKLMAR